MLGEVLAVQLENLLTASLLLRPWAEFASDRFVVTLRYCIVIAAAMFATLAESYLPCADMQAAPRWSLFAFLCPYYLVSEDFLVFEL